MKNENFKSVKTQMVKGKWVILSLVFILFIFTGSVLSQVAQQWVARYNGPSNDYDYATSIALDGSGNVYVTGYSYGSGTYQDYCTIKYNSSGDTVWVRRYNGPGNYNDWSYSIAVDGSGNVYVTGESYGSVTYTDYCTIKYNSSGVQQWVARYNGPGNDEDDAYSIAVDGSGNVYVTGESTGSGTSRDYCTIKYNSSGDTVWVRRYDGPGNYKDWSYSIAVDGSGNVYVTGGSYGSETGPDYCTIKYNSSGVQQWVARYNGPGNNDDRALSIAVDGSGNVYVTGYSYGGGTYADYCTIKYNSSGVQQWEARYNGPGNYHDYANSIAIDNSGNVYVTGYSWGTYYDYCTIKYIQFLMAPILYSPGNNTQGWNTSLTLVWYKVSNAANYRVQVATDSLFNTLIVNDSTLTDSTKAVSGLQNNTWYYWRVAGRNSYGQGPWSAVWKFKTGPVNGLQAIGNEIPKEFKLIQNYPNPFNPITKIRFDLPKNVNVKLTIYDMLGREVETIVNEHLNAGRYEVAFDGTKYTSGVYYYRFNAGEFVETKKMILVK